MGWSERTKPSDLWKQTSEPDHFRAGKDPKGHFTDEETEVNWFAQGHSAIYQQCQAGLPRGRETQGGLLRKICQQLATDLLTGDPSPCVSDETEVRHLLRQEHKASLSLAHHAGHGRNGGDGEQAAEMTPPDPSRWLH